LKEFFTVFEKWELGEVVEDIERISSPSVSSSTQTLRPATLTSATLYRMITNRTIFFDNRIMSYFATHVLPDTLDDWPTFPPGLLLFLVIEHKHLRNWALSLAHKSNPIALEIFEGSYLYAVGLICNAARRQSPVTVKIRDRDTLEFFPFAKSPDLWTGFSAVLRLLPPQWLKGDVGQPLELRRIVLSHLEVHSSRQ
jgi:hypothetical protein